jgi:hypothetical protein
VDIILIPFSVVQDANLTIGYSPYSRKNLIQAPSSLFLKKKGKKKDNPKRRKVNDYFVANVVKIVN